MILHLQAYHEKPDYARCVSIVASASLREMIKPGILAVVSPIVLGKDDVQPFLFLSKLIKEYGAGTVTDNMVVLARCCF